MVIAEKIKKVGMILRRTIQNLIMRTGLFNWISCTDQVNGAAIPPQEVDRLYDWRQNPAAALPNFLCVVGRK